MYSKVQRDDAYIARLLAFLAQEYGLEATGIVPAKRGFYGETWRVEEAGNSYFIKLDYALVHQDIYAQSFAVIEYLGRQGIDFISRIIKTRSGTLYAQFDGAVLGVFAWIEGENIETDASKGPEYNMLAKIYTIPATDLAIPHEDFAGTSAEAFFQRWSALDDRRIDAVMEKNRAKLAYRAARLRQCARLCQSDTTGFVITHGDAGGNLIMDGDEVYIVDWDAPLFAPPERDAWVMACYEEKSEWAKDVFHEVLRENGIEYTLRPERLAYYSYYTFFFYLNEYLECFAQTGSTQGIEECFDTWVEGRIEFADKLVQ